MRNKCVNCRAPLEPTNRADNPGARAQMRYCSEQCKRQYKNKKYYAAHRLEILANARKRAAREEHNEQS